MKTKEDYIKDWIYIVHSDNLWDHSKGKEVEMYKHFPDAAGVEDIEKCPEAYRDAVKVEAHFLLEQRIDFIRGKVREYYGTFYYSVMDKRKEELRYENLLHTKKCKV